MKKHAFEILCVLMLLSGIGIAIAAKPGSEPPPAEPTSRFACFTVQDFGNAICFDKSDQFTLRELDANPAITEVFPYGGVAQNVVATVDEVGVALSN